MFILHPITSNIPYSEYTIYNNQHPISRYNIQYTKYNVQYKTYNIIKSIALYTIYNIQHEHEDLHQFFIIFMFIFHGCWEFTPITSDIPAGCLRCIPHIVPHRNDKALKTNPLEQAYCISKPGIYGSSKLKFMHHD